MTSVSPDVSVVMANHNGLPHLAQAVDSILSQQRVNLELIVVDDGSLDASRDYLRQTAVRDCRLRVVEQQNAGLTLALIAGCHVARAPYIARQDSDDYSLPNRLFEQKQALDRNSSIAFVSCFSNIVGPEGEFLYESRRPLDSISATSLLRSQGGGPVHGSVMMRRCAYEACGGYRPEFFFSQDSDLWLRLVDQGGLMYVPTALYCLRIHPSSISGSLHFLKVPFAEAVTASYRCRAEGVSDRHILEELKGLPIRLDNGSRVPSSSRMTNYFIGSLLLRNRDSRSIGYLAASLWDRKFLLKVLLKLPGAFLLWLLNFNPR